MFITFIITVPFICKQKSILFVHIMVIIGLLLHWYLTYNECILTLIEEYCHYKIYGYYNDDIKFTEKLIKPIYDFNKNHKNIEYLNYSTCIFLLLISLYRIS